MDSATPSNPPAPRSRRKAWLRRGVLVVGLIVSIVLVVQWVVLPRVVTAQVRNALVEAGFTDGTFEVRGASPWRTTIADLTAGAGAIRIETIDVTYEPLAVIEGDLEKITIRGAEVRLPIHRAERPAAHTDAALELPFRKLELKSSAVTFDWQGKTVRLPVSGIIENRGIGRVAARATVSLSNPTGHFDLPGDAKLQSPSGVLNVDATLHSDASGWRAVLRANSEGTVLLSSPGVEADLGRVAVTANVAGSAVDAKITVEGASLKHAGSGLAAAGISAQVPVSMNSQSPSTPGTFEIASVILDQQKLDPIRGSVAIQDGRTELAASWPTITALPMKGWTVAGELSAQAKLAIEDGTAQGGLTITAARADLASKEAEIELQGVSGTVAVDVAGDLVSTPPAQRLTISRAAFGKIELANTSIVFRLEKPDALLLEQVSAGWLGGRVSTKNVKIDPSDPKFEGTLVAQRLSLRELLELTVPERARGEGLMSGAIEVTVDWPEIQLGQGYLVSESKTGEVQVLDTKWLGQAMDQSDPRFRTDSELAVAKQRVLEALADFRYDRLTFNFAEEPASHGLLQVKTHGRGRVGKNPQVVSLNLNFRGINDVLKHGLLLKQKYDELTNPK